MSFLQTDNKDFLFNVNAGLIDGYEQIRKYGINPDCDTSTSPEYVWDGQFEYNYPSANETIYLMSNAISDTNVDVEVQGLVDNAGTWEMQTITKNLNGTAAVLAGSFIRVFRMTVTSSISPAGVVQARTDTTYTAVSTEASIVNLRAQISLDITNTISRNSTLMAMYTVPSNKTAFVYRLFAAVGKNKDAEFDYQVRPLGGSFITSAVIPQYQKSQQFELGYERVEEQSDIRVAVSTENNNTKADASFHFILVDNDKL